MHGALRGQGIPGARAELARAQDLETLAEGLGGGRVGGGQRVEFLRGFIEGAGISEQDGEQQVIGGVVAACVFDLRHGFDSGYLEAGFGRGRHGGTEGACADVRGDLPVIDTSAREGLFRSPFGGGEGRTFRDLLEAIVEDGDYIFSGAGDRLPTKYRAIVQHGGADGAPDREVPGFAGGAEEDSPLGDQTIEHGGALQAVGGECELHGRLLVGRDGGFDGLGSDRWNLRDRRFGLAEKGEAGGQQKTRGDRGIDRDSPRGFRRRHGDNVAGRGG